MTAAAHPADGKTSVVVLTHSPSPYQVELFDAVASSEQVSLEVIYLYTQDPSRKWSPPERRHRFRDLNDEVSACDDCLPAVTDSHLFVQNFYANPIAGRMLQARTATSRPWAFWGERPGFRHPFLGKLMRRWKLRALHSSRAPVWGIGRFALQAYEKEFGGSRSYVDMPYFSDLARFEKSPAASPPPPVHFLYSGSLTSRKGVDLLAAAFTKLAAEQPRVKLKIMGSGGLETEMKRTLAPCLRNVEFTGFKDWHELPATYAEAHVLCVPSRHDGWGLVVPEGLASGLPVIATDRTGAAVEFIEHGKNGWLVPANDADALFNALRRAANLTAEKWNAMSRAARDSVKDHTLEKGAARFIAACHDAIQSFTPRTK